MFKNFRVGLVAVSAAASMLAVGVTLLAAEKGGKGGKGATGASPQQIEANSEDYFLAQDLELSTGAVIPAGTEWYRVPDMARLRVELDDGTFAGDVAWGELVAFGFDLMTDTHGSIGENRGDGLPPLVVGRVANCSSCHAQGGTVPNAWPFFRTITHFGLRDDGDEGAYWGNLAYHRDARVRARDCGRHCGGVVNMPEDGLEMDALMAWLVAVRDGIYEGEGLLIPEFKMLSDSGKIPGARIPLFQGILDMQADPAAGERIYHQSCQGCHGKNGEGKWKPSKGFAGHPPLAGGASFTEAGGPLMIPVLAAFVHRQMPLSSPGSLTEQQALDVSAYVARLPRSTRWWQDFYFDHDPCRRPAFLPLDVGAVPAGYPFSADQTQLGPWREIVEWLGSNVCGDENSPSAPMLDVEFDTGWPDWER